MVLSHLPLDGWREARLISSRWCRTAQRLGHKYTLKIYQSLRYPRNKNELSTCPSTIYHKDLVSVVYDASRLRQWVKSIELVDPSPCEMMALVDWPLEELSIAWSGYSDPNITSVAKITRIDQAKRLAIIAEHRTLPLKHLRIAVDRMTIDMAIPLSQLPIIRLTIEEASLSNGAIKQLCRSTSIVTLDIVNCNRWCNVNLAAMTQLRSLSLFQSSFASMTSLYNAKQLHELQIDGVYQLGDYRTLLNYIASSNIRKIHFLFGSPFYRHELEQLRNAPRVKTVVVDRYYKEVFTIICD
jgi:hypothetical protein